MKISSWFKKKNWVNRSLGEILFNLRARWGQILCKVGFIYFSIKLQFLIWQQNRYLVGESNTNSENIWPHCEERQVFDIIHTRSKCLVWVKKCCHIWLDQNFDPSLLNQETFSKWPTEKKLIFQNRQFSKNFRENFMDWSLG